jgi:hypothetical protein
VRYYSGHPPVKEENYENNVWLADNRQQYRTGCARKTSAAIVLRHQPPQAESQVYRLHCDINLLRPSHKESLSEC